jgi:hypothetical protein
MNYPKPKNFLEADGLDRLENVYPYKITFDIVTTSEQNPTPEPQHWSTKKW